MNFPFTFPSIQHCPILWKLKFSAQVLARGWGSLCLIHHFIPWGKHRTWNMVDRKYNSMNGGGEALKTVVWPLSAILPGSVKLEWWQVGIGGKYAGSRGRDRLWKSHPTDICVGHHKCGKSPQEYKKEPAVVPWEPHMKNTHCFWQGYDCHITHMSGIQWTCDTDIEDTLTNKAAICTGW